MSIRYTVVIGIIVYTNITVDEEYIIFKYVKQKGTKYWPLWSEPCQYTWGRHGLGHTLIAYWSHYRKASNMRGTLVGNIIIDHSDVVGTSPVGAAPTTSSFLTWHLASGIRQRHSQDSTRIFQVLGFGVSYIRDLTLYFLWPHNLHCEHRMQLLPTPLPQTTQGHLPDILSILEARNVVFFMLTWSPLLSIQAFHALNLEMHTCAELTRKRIQYQNKQRFLMPGHQGWNDLHSLCRIGMEYYLLNNDDNNIIYWIMMMIMIMMMMIIIIMIIMMTMMIIGTATIMIMIIIITTTLTMTIMKMIMIKTAQTPCQSLYKDRRI